MPIPNPVAADSTGLPDSQWVSDVRARLRDYPTPFNTSWTADGVGGVFGAGAGPLTISASGPIYDGTPISTYVAVTDNGTPVTVVAAPTAPTAGQVQINYDTRVLTFATAPVSTHTIAVGCYTCKWRDQDILSALYAGLRQMFPSVGKTYVDTSIQLTINNWDFVLPSWAQSPDAKITAVEYKVNNIPTEPWRPGIGWTRVGINQIHVPKAQQFAPIGQLRITGWGPYLTLADLEPDLYNLPIWYAGSVLLPWQESKRIREDTMVPLTQEGGQAPGLLTQTGDYYAKRFDAELKQKTRVYGPPGTSRPIQTTYQMSRHI